MSKKQHSQVDFAVEDVHGEERIYKTFDAALLAASLDAVHHGSAVLDIIVWDEAGAKWLGGDDAVERYNEDPEASVFERIEIKANVVGRVS